MPHRSHPIIFVKKLLFTGIGIFTFLQASVAQFSRHIIQLKDKTGTPYTITNPSQFLTQRAIDRRVRYGISIDQADLPIPPAYIDSIRLAGNVVILNSSKWLNQVCILTTDATALAKIKSFTFVKASSPIAARNASINKPIEKEFDPPASPFSTIVARPQSPADVFNYGLAYPQVHLHNAEFLHNHGFKGETMQLAIMDAGFFQYQSLPTFDSVRTNNQILGTWDFVANEASVNEDNAHGMNCFSTIAANLPGSFIGTAPKSSYYLYRTEDVSSEYPIEEQNFAAAAEKADSLGVDVFSVSLGYNIFDNSIFNYSYNDLDGNTSISTRAADYAASKGILAVVAAGNEGNKTWHYLSAPADADSVLTIGAVNAAGQVAAFSSFGPTSDGRIKPDVAAIGQGAVIANQSTGLPSYNNGTSFATPIMAGIATCLWQAFPEVNNMSIITALRQSSDKANTPDDRTGFGIPDVKKAFVLLLKKLYTQQISIDNNCKTILNWKVKSAANMIIVIERKLPSEPMYSSLFTENSTGSFQSRDFNYIDDLSGRSAGMVKYRLKMTIGADTSFYLDSAVLNYTQSCSVATEKITIGPNPVNDNLTVLVSRINPVKISLTVHSSSGQLVYTVTRQSTGVETFTVPMKHFSRGVYFVTIYLDDRKEVTKKIVR